MFGAYRMIECDLAGGVRRVGRIGHGVAIGSDRQALANRKPCRWGRGETDALARGLGAFQPHRLRCLQPVQASGTADVGLDESICTCDRAVGVALSGEVHDGVKRFFTQPPLGQRFITDVAVHEWAFAIMNSERHQEIQTNTTGSSAA